MRERMNHGWLSREHGCLGVIALPAFVKIIFSFAIRQPTAQHPWSRESHPWRANYAPRNKKVSGTVLATWEVLALPIFTFWYLTPFLVPDSSEVRPGIEHGLRPYHRRVVPQRLPVPPLGFFGSSYSGNDGFLLSAKVQNVELGELGQNPGGGFEIVACMPVSRSWRGFECLETTSTRVVAAKSNTNIVSQAVKSHWAKANLSQSSVRLLQPPHSTIPIWVAVQRNQGSFLTSGMPKQGKSLEQFPPPVFNACAFKESEPRVADSSSMRLDAIATRIHIIS
ncbi:hypothetical protein LF1_03740 [Rubripirellula obstinata]|uniref:Uncharacterized protein n=1 Tax=Rubripirellula obstinata TaxID=406547 RepID=A0A5B1CEW8_9BACT|nr:hypothetical protein LF1_03740 [Rubripirellula obstinata]